MAITRHQTILQRYESSPEGDILIDIATQRVEDLYNNFDRFAPYARKDLDSNLVQYVVDCAQEIGALPWRLRIALPSVPNDRIANSIRNSFRSYFSYLIDLEKRRMHQRIRTSFALLSAGLLLLLVALLVNQRAALSDAIPLQVFAEGLTVAAWVALWQVMATYLIHWMPHRRSLKLYRTLTETPIEFRVADRTNQSSVVSGITTP
jgi:hypothetical protein